MCLRYAEGDGQPHANVFVCFNYHLPIAMHSPVLLHFKAQSTGVFGIKVYKISFSLPKMMIPVCCKV